MQFYKVYKFVAILQTRKLSQKGEKVTHVYSNTIDFFVYWSYILQPCKTHLLILMTFFVDVIGFSV